MNSRIKMQIVTYNINEHFKANNEEKSKAIPKNNFLWQGNVEEDLRNLDKKIEPK